MIWQLLVELRASTCDTWGHHPAHDPGLPGTHSQLTEKHVCLLMVHDQKQTNPTFTQASPLAEGHHYESESFWGSQLHLGQSQDFPTSNVS